MLDTIRDLFRHQAWADTAILAAVRKQDGAAEDAALRRTLHHIVLVQRVFLSVFLGRAFDLEAELRSPASFDALEALFREAHREELAFVDALDDAGLARTVPLPWIEGLRPSVEQALMQVVMHSQSHRGQCAAALRALGGEPPMTDFIIWLKDRPLPV